MSFGNHFHTLNTCGDRRTAGAENPVNQRDSGIWAGYVGVLLWLNEEKYVSSYRGGVRKLYVLAKVELMKAVPKEEEGYVFF